MSTQKYGPMSPTAGAHVISGFPEGFLWGTGASAFQVEGAWDVDGKGPSIWDTAFHMGRLVAPDGTSGDCAIDQYHRLEGDLDLLARLGAPVHRFSVAWPRVMPDGATLNPAGLDYYDRMVDAILERSLMPAVNLYHWDLPQVLEEQGGWMRREAAYRFADYVAVVVQRLGDRVTHWFTMNEPSHPTLGGYVAGILPPFRPRGGAGFASVHHLLLAHGLALQALRVSSSAPVGIIMSLAGVRPVSSHPADLAAAEAAGAVIDPLFCEPLLRGRHIDPLADLLGDAVRDGDSQIISAPLDLFGVNWYSTYSVAAPGRVGEFLSTAPAQWSILATLAKQTPPLGFVIVPQPGLRWTQSHRQITPGGLSEVLRWLDRVYPEHPPIIVTENGIGLKDIPESDGTIADEARIAYLADNITDLYGVMVDGVDVRGFWVWSAWDNLQWHLGFTQRFGLVHVDPVSQRRTPKRSFEWFRQVVASNAAVLAEDVGPGGSSGSSDVQP